MTIVLDAAAVATWFTLVVLGERLVADATAARRAAEVSAQEAVLTATKPDCEGGGAAKGSSGRYAVSVSQSVSSGGSIEANGIVSSLANLSLGQAKTREVYSRPFRQTVTETRADGVRGHALVDSSSRSFRSRRSLACVEPSLDQPTTSISDYRTSLFGAHIQGY